MATQIRIKKSTTASSVPPAGSLAQGELAVNITDQKMWVGTGGPSDPPVLLVDYTAPITSVGTLTSGTLGNGFTTVATNVGGTGLTSFATNGAVYATTTSNLTTGTLPVASGGTGITSFGTGISTWLGTPSSDNLRTAITDETGSGVLVFNDSPSFTGNVTISGTISASNIVNSVNENVGDVTINFQDFLLFGAGII
jgi:hypothetical protein